MNLLDIFFKPKKRKLEKIISSGDVEYKYIKKKNSKSVKITVPDAFSVVVSMPYACTYDTAKQIAEKNKSWIENRLSLMKEKEKSALKPENLIIERGLINTSIKKRGENIIFTYPVNKDFYSKEIQTEYKKAIKRALYVKAKSYLPKRLDELAQKFGFKYNKLSLKLQKSRWGSCSYKNNINLNINLIALENKFIDYVLIHELCHTVEKNHQKAFWNLVLNCMPDALEIRRELKKQKFTLSF